MRNTAISSKPILLSMSVFIYVCLSLAQPSFGQEQAAATSSTLATTPVVADAVVAIASAVTAETGRIRLRPATWAQPMLSTQVSNFYKVDDNLYRCAQPDDEGMPALEKFGIKSVLCLRHFHDDDDEAEDTKLKLYRINMSAGSISYDQIVAALRIIHNADKPIAIHCWHGSDRTGCIAAAYRIVFQGWSKQAAIDELYHGGYGFHSTFFKNIPRLLNSLDTEALKKDVLAPVEAITEPVEAKP